MKEKTKVLCCNVFIPPLCQFCTSPKRTRTTSMICQGVADSTFCLNRLMKKWGMLSHWDPSPFFSLSSALFNKSSREASTGCWNKQHTLIRLVHLTNWRNLFPWNHNTSISIEEHTHISECRVKFLKYWHQTTVENPSVAMDEGGSIGISWFAVRAISTVVRASIPLTGQDDHPACKPNSKEKQHFTTLKVPQDQPLSENITRKGLAWIVMEVHVDEILISKWETLVVFFVQCSNVTHPINLSHSC